MIRQFFNKLGLNWSGFVYKNKSFVEFCDKDLKNLKAHSFVVELPNEINFGLIAEIDDVTFRILSLDQSLPIYSNNENFKERIKIIKKLENKDFSKDFIKFQLDNNDKLYSSMIKEKFIEKKNLINLEAAKREKQLKRKIEFLNKSIKKNEKIRIDRIREIDEFISLTNKYEETSENSL